MKDEIKEILYSIQEHLKEKEEKFKKGAVDSTVYYLYCDDARILLDCITNLQEENKEQRDIIELAQYYIDKYMYENYAYCGSEDRLKEILSGNEFILKQLKELKGENNE